MIPFRLQDGTLLVGAAGTPAALPAPVYEAVAFADTVVALVAEPARNVYGVGADGRVLWRIPSVRKSPASAFAESHYALGIVDDTTAVAVEASGMAFDLDVRTGAVLRAALSK